MESAVFLKSMVKFKTREEAEAFVDKQPLSNLRYLMVELLMEQQQPVKKVSITEEQLKCFFKITGVAQDGGAEKRGRPKKKNENSLFNEE